MLPGVFRNSFQVNSTARGLRAAAFVRFVKLHCVIAIFAREATTKTIMRHAACKVPDVNSVIWTSLRALIASLTLGALLFGAGCERVEYRSVPGDSIRSGWASPERPSLIASAPSEQQFLVTVAQGALFEIAASRLAAARGGSPAVRRFAEATLRERIAADTDLQQLAASVGVALPSQLSDTLQARLDVLRELHGGDFDRAYARNVGVMAQEEALTTFERAADRHGARVQRFAAEQLPAIRKHLEWARELASELDHQTMA